MDIIYKVRYKANLGTREEKIVQKPSLKTLIDAFTKVLILSLRQICFWTLYIFIYATKVSLILSMFGQKHNNILIVKGGPKKMSFKDLTFFYTTKLYLK